MNLTITLLTKEVLLIQLYWIMVDLYSVQDKLKFEQIPFLKTYSYAAVALIVDEDGNILVERRSEKLDDPWAGQFAFPGGHYDNGDQDLLDTVIREVREETGLELKREKIMGYFGPFSPRNKMDLLVYVFVYNAEGNERKSALVQSKETDFLGWISIADLQAGRSTMDHEVVFKLSNGIIWGMSARILETFLKMMNNE